MNKRKIILIIYENIVREYDNALLLKAEFERRGYKVRLCYKTESFCLLTDKIVAVLTPNCYTSENWDFYRYTFAGNGIPLISLQYEQIISEKIEHTKVHIPKDKARFAWLFCWGSNCMQRLLANGIDRSKIRICGAVHLDFLREEFRQFYLTREEIAKRLNLDVDKKWILYISSFSYVDNRIVTKYLVNELKDDTFVYDFVQFSTESQRLTLTWFESFMEDHPNSVLIYRPHPMEAENKTIKRIVQEYPQNFRLISDLNIKQWILVSDVITTWFSTSAGEVYAAGKPLVVIRPLPFPHEYDVPFYYDANCVTTYKQLSEMLSLANPDCAVKREVMQEYFDITPTPAYIRVADAVVNLIDQADNSKEKFYFWHKIQYMFQKHTISKIIVKKIYQILFFYCGFKITNPKLRQEFAVSDWERSIKHHKDPVNLDKYKCLQKIVQENETK